MGSFAGVSAENEVEFRHVARETLVVPPAHVRERHHRVAALFTLHTSKHSIGEFTDSCRCSSWRVALTLYMHVCLLEVGAGEYYARIKPLIKFDTVLLLVLQSHTLSTTIVYSYKYYTIALYSYMLRPVY